MPDDPTVQLIHAEPIGKGRERIVALLEGGDIAVATRQTGEEKATVEISFNLGEATRLAERAIAGSATALTMPGLARILSGAVIVLSRAAHQAGAIAACDDPGEDDGVTGDGPER